MLPACALSGAAERHRGRMDVLVRFQDARRHYNTSACGPQPSLAKQQTMSLFTSCQNTPGYQQGQAYDQLTASPWGIKETCSLLAQRYSFCRREKRKCLAQKTKKGGTTATAPMRRKKRATIRGWDCRPNSRVKIAHQRADGVTQDEADQSSAQVWAVRYSP